MESDKTIYIPHKPTIPHSWPSESRIRFEYGMKSCIKTGEQFLLYFGKPATSDVEMVVTGHQ